MNQDRLKRYQLVKVGDGKKEWFDFPCWVVNAITWRRSSNGLVGNLVLVQLLMPHRHTLRRHNGQPRPMEGTQTPKVSPPACPSHLIANRPHQVIQRDNLNRHDDKVVSRSQTRFVVFFLFVLNDDLLICNDKGSRGHDGEGIGDWVIR